MESHKRTIVRSITYRVAAVLITAVFTGFSTAIGIHILLTILYYIHERLWTRVSWGKL